MAPLSSTVLKGERVENLNEKSEKFEIFKTDVKTHKTDEQKVIDGVKVPIDYSQVRDRKFT